MQEICLIKIRFFANGSSLPHVLIRLFWCWLTLYIHEFLLTHLEAAAESRLVYLTYCSAFKCHFTSRQIVKLRLYVNLTRFAKMRPTKVKPYSASSSVKIAAKVNHEGCFFMTSHRLRVTVACVQLKLCLCRDSKRNKIANFTNMEPCHFCPPDTLLAAANWNHVFKDTN